MIKELHVSKNLFDATMEQGTITINGDIAADNRIRTKEYIDIDSDYITLSWNSEQNTEIYIMMYDANEDYVRGEGWVTSPATKQVPSNVKKIRIIWRYVSQTDILPSAVNSVMLVSGQTALPYEPYGDTWNTKSYAKIVDTTHQVTSFPVVVRPMEHTIPSWTIKGNMVQDGTPSPSNIIYPSECGEMTENLYNKDSTPYSTTGYVREDGTIGDNNNYNISAYIELSPNTQYNVSNMNVNGLYPAICFYTDNKTFISGIKYNGATELTFTTPTNCRYALVSYLASNKNSVMLVEGSTAPSSFIPYGYKLDIKSGNTTTPVYFGEVQSTRKIKKYEITGLEGWITRSGTPANVFFCERQGVNFINNAAICSHYANQDSGSFDDLQDKHFIVKIASSGDKTYFGIRDSSYPSTNEGANQLRAYLQQQYANGTPVCVWYVLATETTTTLNEPLRKIGDYADSVSGTNLSVTAQSPTTIDVDTTLKPSEMDLTYTGTKMCKRKRKSANLCDTDNPNVYRGYYNSNTGKISAASTNAFVYIPIEPNTKYYFSGLKRYNANEKILLCTTASVPNNGVDVIRTAYLTQMTTSSITTTSEERFIALYLCGDADYTGYGSVNAAITANVSETMINTGSSALPYAPYWK